MSVSVLTSKGQTTIPKDVREALNLKPHDKLIYIIENNRVIMMPSKGDILDLKGSVKENKSLNFKKLRQNTKKTIAKKIAEEDKWGL